MQQESVFPRSRARGLRRTVAVFVLAGTGTLVSGALAPALAETVYLRDGRIIRGEVHERTDGKIEITHRHGALVVDRDEIARVESESSGALKTNPNVDTVYVLDGRVLTGNVTVAEDTKEIVVTNEKFGGETRIARDMIRSIIFRKGKQAPAAVAGVPGAAANPADEDTEKKWRAQIDASLAKLRNPLSDRKEKDAARRELLGLGVYATQYIKDTIAAVGSRDQVVLPVLNDVLRVAQLKSVIAPVVEEHDHEICEKLIDPDPEHRVKVIEDVAIFAPNEAPPLLLHLIQHDPSPRVQAICVGELSMLKRYDDLGAVLKMRENGRLRFVAALELGEAGIYAGIPVIIEALKLEGAEFNDARVAAIEALKRFTGQGDLGYLPLSDDVASRVEATKRWEAWWTAKGKALVDKSLQSFNLSEISEADKAKALDRWREGNKALDEIDRKDKDAGNTPRSEQEQKARSYAFELAAQLFKEASDLDPTLCSARLSRALVLYEQLGRPREAETELKLILSRFAPEDANYPRLLATYHLGRLAELEGSWRHAELRYDEAGHMDPLFFDAYIGAGDCCFEQALAASSRPLPGTPEPAKPTEGKPIENGVEAHVGSEVPAATGNRPASDSEIGLGEKQTRDDHLLRAIGFYRRAIESIDKKAEALKSSARDLGGVTGEAENFQEGRLLTTIRTDRESLTKRAAQVWFKLGRAQSARAEGKEALAAFKAARALDSSDPRYNQACNFWEEALRGSGK